MIQSQKLLLTLFITLVVTVLVLMYRTVNAPLIPKPATHLTLTRCDPRSNPKDLIIRGAYFDDRERSNHQNATVFLVSIKKTHIDNILDCGVDGVFTTQHAIRSCIHNGYDNKVFPNKTHDHIMLDCFDLPATNHSRAFIRYRKIAGNSTTRESDVKNQRTSSKDRRIITRDELPIAVEESEKAVYIPQTKSQLISSKVKRGNALPRPTVAACVAVLYKSPFFVTDWLQYQKTLGFDHVHFIVERSFVELGNLKDPLLVRMMEEGYLTVDIWEPRLVEKCETFYHSQILAYQACLYRLRSEYDYIFTLDTDDFFVPLMPNQKDIHHYAQTWCSRGACVFTWLECYPECGMKERPAVFDGNLTSLLVSNVIVKKTDQGKSMRLSKAMLDAGIHRDGVFVESKGYKTVFVPENIAYVAHLRKGKFPESC